MIRIFVLCLLISSLEAADALRMSFLEEEYVVYFDVDPESQLFAVAKQKNPEFLYQIHCPQSGMKTLPDPRDRADFATYYVHTPRSFMHASPRKGTAEDLIHFFGKKQVAVYTGAGLSAASGIPTMQQLTSDLKRYAPNWPHDLNHEQVLETIQNFWHACQKAHPTPAHRALQALATHHPFVLFTENLDALHEVTGLKPIRIHPDHLPIQEQTQSLEALICLGLSHDDKGFIGYIKKVLPQIQLIAVNFSKPLYLGPDDLWIEADLQQVLPQVERVLQEKDIDPEAEKEA